MSTTLRTPRLDALVADGVLPGYSVAVRDGGDFLLAVAGSTEPDGAGTPVTTGTSYRLASLSKPVAALLAAGLVADGVLSAEDAVTRWVPELGGLQVLRHPEGPLDDTEPQAVAMTVHHLLTMTSGLGIGTSTTPLTRAMEAAGIHPGPVGPSLTRAEVLARLAALPLAFQPGAGWAYHSSTDVLSVVLERASGMLLPDLLRERLTGPLGTGSLSFEAPDPGLRAPALFVEDDVWRPIEPDGPRPDVLPTLSAGLWGSAPDVLRVLDELVRPTTLAPGDVEVVRRPALTDAQRESAADFLPPGYSYGWQVSVATEDDPQGPRAGSVGWMGGTGTLGIADPATDRTCVLLTNRGLDGPRGAVALEAFLGDVRDLDGPR